MELLAGLTVTRKAVERHAEAIGEDIAARQQACTQRDLQLELPEVAAPRIPVIVYRNGWNGRTRGTGLDGRPERRERWRTGSHP